MSATVLKPTELLTPEVKHEVNIQQAEEKQVIVHCSMPCIWGLKVRIWKTTYLITEDGQRMPLLFWDGISLYPQWTPVHHHGIYQFTLIFAGLPSDCKVFSLVEEISEPGGFYVSDIHRNELDVYDVDLTE
jgi:hypothetical protein